MRTITAKASSSLDSLKWYLAFGAGLVLPMTFLRVLRPFAKIGTASDAAVGYLVSWTGALVAAGVAWILVEAIARMFSRRHGPAERERRRDTIHHSALLLLTVVWLTDPFRYWLMDFITPSAVPRTQVVLGIGMAVLSACAIWQFRASGSAGLVDWLRRCVYRLYLPARWIAVGGCVAALAVVAVRGPGDRGVAVPRAAAPVPGTTGVNIILLTVDTFSARHSELYGHPFSTTPNLAAFAQESTVFEQAHAACNFTTCSVSSIVTGTYPFTHHVYSGFGFLRTSSQRESLPSRLHAAGYETAAFTGNWWASPIHIMNDGAYDHVDNYGSREVRRFRVCPWAGCDFDRLLGNFPFTEATRFLTLYTRWQQHGASYRYPNPPSLEYERARRFLANRDSSRPFFLWVHTMAPHQPHLSEPPFRGRYLPGESYASVTAQQRATAKNDAVTPEAARAISLRYDELLTYADFHLGQFLSWLRERRLLDDTLVVIASDHGESFERNMVGHGGPQVYENVVHVPLVIHMPGQAASKRVREPVSQVDLLPTLLDYAGIHAPTSSDGQSLRPLIDGGEGMPRRIFTMNLERDSAFAPLDSGTIAVIEWPLKYIGYLDTDHRPEGELFDLAADPAERHDLVAERPADARRLRAVVLERASMLEGGGAPVRSAMAK